ncbi:MAG: hypothetical protein VW270_27600 [Candidatus Poseidoniales archaeon]|jgi:hypothetical protein
MNVDALKSQISAGGGPARPNYYVVQMPSIGNMSGRELNLLTQTVTLPGRQIVSNERRIGVTFQKMAYGYAVEDVSMTFLCLNDYKVRKYFEEWQNLAINQSTGEIGYHKDYTKDLVIKQMKKGFGFPLFNYNIGRNIKLPSEITNRLPKVGPIDFAQGELDIDFISEGDTIYECKLFDAYPTSLQAIELGDGNNDSIVQVSVQLSYRNWEGKYPQIQSKLGTQILGTALTNIASRVF